MKVKVIKDFADKKQTWVTHKVGELIDVDDNRAKDLIGRGLAAAPVTAKAEDDKPVPKTGKKGKKKNVSEGETGASDND